MLSILDNAQINRQKDARLNRNYQTQRGLGTLGTLGTSDPVMTDHGSANFATTEPHYYTHETETRTVFIALWGICLTTHHSQRDESNVAAFSSAPSCSLRVCRIPPLPLLPFSKRNQSV